MEFLSVALVIIAAMAYKLIEKYLDQKESLNKGASNDALSTALDEQLKKFNGRINDTWVTISSTKQELEALKLMIGLRNK